MLMQGNVACVEGAIEAGCRFFAGYPITPASEIMNHMVKRVKEAVFIQMEDEIASISACIGASWAGVKAMTATSGPGFSLMQEGIGFAAMTETPCVVVDVQRAGPSTGQATKVAQGDVIQSRFGSQGDYETIVLAPSSAQEMYDLTVEAFNLSEKFRTPAILLADETVGRLSEEVSLKDFEIVNRKRGYTKEPFGGEMVPPMPAFGDGCELLITGSTHDARGYRKTQDSKVQKELLERLKKKVEDHRDEIFRHEAYNEDSKTILVSFGIEARACHEACLRLNGKVGFLKLNTIWPFNFEKISEILEGKRAVVVELNYGQLSMLIRN
ncbi:MAG TPA: 2-oxoacid:acceptor oxidoreductase subunit alpha [Thermoplasmata archaeon]|nr:2-oxoacid:acceptor oxidoreductase subunit alpha [Thermoplasmata archaeon]